MSYCCISYRYVYFKIFYYKKGEISWQRKLKAKMEKFTK